MFYGNVLQIRFIISILLLLTALILSLSTADCINNPFKVFHNLLTSDSQSLNLAILWQIRMPRALFALVTGISLSVSGYILQVLTNNCLADPFIIGIASGAGLFSILGLFCGLSCQLLPAIAFLGSLLTCVIVLKLAHQNQLINSTRLLLSGFAISSLCSAVMTLLVLLNGNNLKVMSLLYWLFGTLANKTLADLNFPVLIAILGVSLTLYLAKALRILNLGISSASNFGLNVPKLQLSLLILAVLMCSSVTAYCGIIGFVGLISPNIGRKIFYQDERYQIMGTAIIGSIIVVVADILTRITIPGQDLPIGSVLALIGSPFFLYLMNEYNFEN